LFELGSAFDAGAERALAKFSMIWAEVGGADVGASK